MSTFDYVVVGGGAAGAVIAARLAQRGQGTVALLEWGASDEDEPRALQLDRWPELFESEHAVHYPCEPQAAGNGAVLQTRGRILGGSSSVNTMITWRPLASDLDEWVAAGAAGWDAPALGDAVARFRETTRFGPVAPADRNPFLADAVQAAATALDVPLRSRWNDGSAILDGAGFVEIAYDPSTGRRSSSSASYLHPIADRDGLQVRTHTRATRLLLEGDRAVGVQTLAPDGTTDTVRARREVVLCCGAIDTPRLLLQSGIGPAGVLRAAGIAPVHELPGVGENLQDHPEGLVVWEAARDLPHTHASYWDAAVLARLDPGADRPDVVIHLPLMTYADHALARGVAIPERSITMTPNVAKPHSRGRVWVDSADPDAPPRIDYGSFTDPDGHDARVLVEGVRLARRIARAQPAAPWFGAEVFPGPDVVSDADLSEVVRATHSTVFHVCGTCRMGAPDDPLAVVDPQLRVRGLTGLRVADASVFPTMTALNPVGMVMVLAERAAQLIGET